MDVIRYGYIVIAVQPAKRTLATWPKGNIVQ